MGGEIFRNRPLPAEFPKSPGCDEFLRGEPFSDICSSTGLSASVKQIQRQEQIPGFCGISHSVQDRKNFFSKLSIFTGSGSIKKIYPHIPLLITEKGRLQDGPFIDV
jgi:hypothetical protein